MGVGVIMDNREFVLWIGWWRVGSGGWRIGVDQERGDGWGVEKGLGRPLSTASIRPPVSTYINHRPTQCVWNTKSRDTWACVTKLMCNNVNV